MNDKTLEALAALKIEGHKDIFLVDVGGLEIIFRPLTFKEFSIVASMEEHLDGPTINEYIVRCATFYIEDYDKVDNWLDDPNTLAITPDTLAEQILVASGFEDADKLVELLEKKREEANEMQSLMQIFICSAFRSLTPDDINNMTLSEQLSLFAKAEVVLNKKMPIDEMLKGGSSSELNIPEGFESTMVPPHDILSAAAADLPPVN